ncbi:MAG TPA: TolC family protein [Myxococcales bacterium]|nr:TolC family protein [Myxococcales bacterium]
MIAAALVALALSQSSPPAVLTLDQALQGAQAHNPDLQVAGARLQQARQVAWKVWAGYLPQISVGGAYTRNNTEARIMLPTGYYVRNVGQPQGPVFDPAQPTSTDNPPGAQTSYILFPSGLADVTIQKQDQLGAQAQLSQALLVPALWPAIANAYTAERLAGQVEETTRREILFGVAQLYYGAAGLKTAISVQERLLQLAREREKDADVRFRAGASLKLALLRAQIDRSRAEQDLKRAQNAYLSARQALATILDRAADFEVEQPAAPALPPDPAALQTQALDQRPDVAAARTAESLARGARTGTWFKYLPAVVGTATYRVANVTGFTGKYDSWALGLGLSWTIFDGGAREAEARENDAKVAETAAALHAAENKARDELARAFLDLDSARASRSKADEQLKLARESFQLAKVNLQAGAASDLDLQEAQAALTGAEIAAVAESLNADLSALRVLKAAGAFNPPR